MKTKLKIIISVVVLILLVTLLVFLFIFAFKSIRVNNKALKAFNNGSFKHASENFNKEILKQPSNYSLLNNAAGAEYKLSKFDDASLKYNDVINSSSSHMQEKFTAFYDLGNVEYMKGDFQKAVDLYKEALKLVPEDKDAKYNLEAALLKLNEKNSTQNNNKKNKDDKQQSQQPNKQNNSDKQTNKQEQDLKKQMDQNEAAQKENEKTSGKANNSAKKSEGKSQNQQKDSDTQRQSLQKQKREISEKIKALKDKRQANDKIPKDTAQERKEEAQKDKQGEPLGAISREKNGDNKKDRQPSMFLNYYDELDKKADKLRNKNKKPLLSQPKEDW
jgi:tetratricopeptide (TPR) repeat protein